MLKQITNKQTAVRPTTEIEEAIAQLRDHRMSAPPIAEVRMPQPTTAASQVSRSRERFGFPVEFGS